MCQLTFANTHNELLNQLIITTQLLRNTETDHKDGFGLYSNGKTFRLNTEPHLIYDFASCVKRQDGNLPYIAHVRKSSYARSNNAALKENKVEHNHPFETEDFVLAHNGTLLPIENYLWEIYPDAIDSQIFLYELQRKYNENKKENFITVIQDLMDDEFKGPFAFLIHNKHTNKYYGCRGKLRQLHISSVAIRGNKEVFGYVINTSYQDLKVNLDLVQQIYLLETGIDLEFQQLKYFAENSIYELNEKTVRNVAGIIEKDVNWQPKKTPQLPLFPSGNKELEVKTESKPKDLIGISKRVADFLTDYCLTDLELDELLYLFAGKGLISFKVNELENALKDLRGILAGKWSKNKSKAWDEVNMYKLIQFDAYEIEELQFPWLMNETSELKHIAGIARKEYLERGN